MRYSFVAGGLFDLSALWKCSYLLTYLLTYIIVVITDDHDVGDLILCDLSSVGTATLVVKYCSANTF